jgi:hypothetical protein
VVLFDCDGLSLKMRFSECGARTLFARELFYSETALCPALFDQLQKIQIDEALRCEKSEEFYD